MTISVGVVESTCDGGLSAKGMWAEGVEPRAAAVGCLAPSSAQVVGASLVSEDDQRRQVAKEGVDELDTGEGGGCAAGGGGTAGRCWSER
jgi:hypothetical protein